jgi:hypothetical protein
MGEQREVKKRRKKPKYMPDYCEEIVLYFSQDPQVTHFKKTYHANGNLKSEEPVVLPRELPTFQGFADQIGVCQSTLEQWREKYPAFDQAYRRAKQLQEKIVLVNSISGLYSCQFAQFFTKNCLKLGEQEGEPEEKTKEADFSVKIQVVD